MAQNLENSERDEAFEDIIRRFAPLVYGVGLRSLGNAEGAAEVVQEMFFEFWRCRERIRESLGGWLHRVATRKAVDLIRREAARRQRERDYAQQPPPENSWAEVAPLVDAALEEASAEARELLVQRFLEGLTTVELAGEMGLSQATVSRRVEAALEEVRRILKRKGVIVGAVLLGGFLEQNATAAFPASLLVELGKMAVLGNAGAGAALAGKAGITMAMGLKAKLAITAAVILGAGTVYFSVRNTGNSAKPAPTPVTTPSPRPRPAPIMDLSPASAAPAVTTPDVIKPPEAPPAPEPPQMQPAPAAQENPAIPLLTSSPDSSFKFDLSTPQATILSFSHVFLARDFEKMRECFVPGAQDYQDLINLLAGKRGPEPQTWLESLGEPVTVTSTEKEGDGIVVKWTFIITRDFILERHTLTKGSAFEMDAKLVQRGDKWLITGI